MRSFHWLGILVGAILLLNLMILTSPVSVEVQGQQRATGRWVDLRDGYGACFCPDWDSCQCLRF
jgi:hypothetical protein